MTLSQICARDFDGGVRSRGQKYFESGRVRVASHDTERITATVQGSGSFNYLVGLTWLPEISAIVAVCTCPHYDGGDLCKHIWATMLEGQSLGWATGADSHTDVLHESLDTDLNSFGRNGDLFDDEDDEDDDFDSPPMPAYFPAPARVTKSTGWKSVLEAIHYDALSRGESDNDIFVPARQAWYVINVGASDRTGSLVIDYYHRQRLRSGELGKVKRQGVSHHDIQHFEEPADRHRLELLLGNTPREESSYGYEFHPSPNSCHLSPVLYPLVLPTLCASRRLVAAGGPAIQEDALQPIDWGGDDPWNFHLQLSSDDKKKCWILNGSLRRGSEEVPVQTPELLLEDGLMLHAGALFVLDTGPSDFSWIEVLRQVSQVSIPYQDRIAFLERWWASPHRPELDLPDVLDLPVVSPTPRPRLSVLRPSSHDGRWRYAKVGFQYESHLIDADDVQHGMVVADQVMVRNPEIERDFLAELAALGVIRNAGHYYRESGSFHFGKAKIDSVVFALLDKGWMVEVEKVRVRIPGLLNVKIESGIDWFELAGGLEYEGTEVGLPALLRAMQRGDDYLLLADGSKGLLPPKWVTEHRLLQFGLLEGDEVRFKPSQALLLDAILAAQNAKSEVDSKFAGWRRKLESFAGVKPRAAPRGFRGSLRPYQEDGLGWLGFLREFRLGGCLADDMGLGKTIQVLALLESVRTTATRPSMVVVPRSLVFNWIAEAARFTPQLKVLDYTGTERAAWRAVFAEHHLIVTTYGTVRKDITQLQDVHFEYVILDEAQAIKNAASVTAKACRILTSGHRLAMTGTPIENHLGELWSLFEFLNPGLLGAAKDFARLVKTRADNTTALNTLAAGLRPYILRRTKRQVASDLPSKTEQTIYCEMESKQREQYEELRRYYAASLQSKVAADGLNRSKIQVLEALLRLRQAACHPGLVDISRKGDDSAKLTALTEQITEVLEGGHKALVFSQFTKFLALVRNDLDARGIDYEYLDGRTKKREERVMRFQEDPASKLFLISLKAGGHGLNLTAADYVFLLDPWWNPAVEAQAVSRAHRIGQTRPVFAYRLIARDTVEEKILELQDKKLALAESIIREDQNILRTLTTQDLALLLS